MGDLYQAQRTPILGWDPGPSSISIRVEAATGKSKPSMR